MKILTLIKSYRSSLSLLAVAFILPFIFTSLLLPVFIFNEDWLNDAPLLTWTLTYVVLSLAMGLAAIHTTLVSLISGYFLGWLSLPFLILSYLAASCLGFLIAQLADRGNLMNKLLELKGAGAIADDLKKNEFMVIFFCRLSPVLPFAVINLLLSLLKADFRKFLVAGTLGMIPRSLLFVFIGIQAKSIREALSNNTGNSLDQILVLILLIISVLGLFYYIIHAYRQKSKHIGIR